MGDFECKIENRTVIPAGMDYDGSQARISGPLCIRHLCDRKWQPEAYTALVGHWWRRLLAPTGSGKSTVARALLWADLKAGFKVIVAFPQTVISRSFETLNILLPSGEEVQWDPGKRLIDSDESTIEALVQFVVNPPGPTPRSRILICTHATLVRAHQRLMEAGHSWAGAGGVSLGVDESHFVKADGEDEEGYNELGKVVAHFLRLKPGPLLLMTATWLRGDLSRILSKEARCEFATYQYTADRYLAEAQYLREVVFSYIVGPPEEALRFLHKDPGKRTMMFMRSVRANEIEQKYVRVRSYLNALGPVVKTSPYLVTHTLEGQEVLTLDLVSEIDRDSRKKAFLKSLDDHTGQPNFTLALLIGKMGLDWEECNQVIIDQKRNSYPDIIQMIGRALRDFKGKGRVDIIILLDPLKREDAEYTHCLQDYLKTLLASMVIEWQFQAPAFPKDATEKQKKAIEKVRSNPDLGSRILDKVMDAALHSPTGKPEEATLNDAIDELLADDFDAEERKGIADFTKAEVLKKNRALRDLHYADDIPLDLKFDTSISGGLRIHAFRLGTTLTELRGKMDRMPFRKLMAEVARRNIRTREEYRAQYKDIPGAPKDPGTYKDFQGWKHFIGKAKGIIRKKKRAAVREYP